MKTGMGKLCKNWWFPSALAFLYLILTGILVYLPLTRSKGGIEVLLTKLVPRILWTDSLLIVIALYLCRRDIAEAFKALWQGEESISTRSSAPCPDHSARIPIKRAGLALPAIFLFGLFLVAFVAPQVHRIYYDEDIYGNMAQNMAATGQTGMANYGTFEYGEYFVNWLQYNKDPSGWPFLLSLVFLLFGVNETWMFVLNNLLFSGGAVIVFFITRLLAGGLFPGILAALIYSLIPHNLIWSNTGAAETSAAFFGGLTVLCALAYLKTRMGRHLFLLSAVLPLASYMRPESVLIGLWVMAALLLGPWFMKGRVDAFAPYPLATREFWAFGLITLALLIPHLWHFYAMSGQSWGAPGAKFSMEFFPKNFAVNSMYYLNNKSFPVLFTLLALTGFAAQSGQWKEKADFFSAWLMLLWFLFFWGIFLFFYAGSYKFGADVRFALVSFMPIAVLAGFGGKALHRLGARWLDCRKRPVVAALLVIVLIFSWLKFLPLIRLVGQEAWGARYDHQYAREFIKKIPNRAIVLTQVPTMFLLWGQNAIQTYAGLNNPGLIKDLMKKYDGEVYFHYNYWCNTLSEQNRQLCEGIGKRYDLKPIAEAREQTYKYALYKMSLKE